MRVILLKDMPKLGSQYQIINVSDGYARNFLLPHQAAALATVPLTQWAQQQQQRVKNQQRRQQNFKAGISAKLQDQRLIVRVKANDQGTLYEGLHTAQIIQAIKAQLGIELQEKDIKLDQNIKCLGTFTVKVITGAGQATPVELLVRATD